MYTATDPHYFWDGQYHYWTGQSVNGMERQPDYQGWWDMYYHNSRLQSKSGAAVKARLKELGKTQLWFARKLGVHESQIGYALNKQGVFPRAHHGLVKKLLGLELEYINPEGIWDGFECVDESRGSRKGALRAVRGDQGEPG